jgi:hypothetical protein
VRIVIGVLLLLLVFVNGCGALSHTTVGCAATVGESMASKEPPLLGMGFTFYGLAIGFVAVLHFLAAIFILVGRGGGFALAAGIVGFICYGAATWFINNAGVDPSLKPLLWPQWPGYLSSSLSLLGGLWLMRKRSAHHAPV